MSLIETNKSELTGPDAVNELHFLLLKHWQGTDDLIAATREKVRIRRIAIGRLLLELQRRIDSGENGDLCNFWEWFDDMVPNRSRSDAEHLMTIARQPDPEVAYQKKLEKQKEYTSRHYQKKLGLTRPPPYKAEDNQPPETTPEPEVMLPLASPKPKKRSGGTMPSSKILKTHSAN